MSLTTCYYNLREQALCGSVVMSCVEVGRWAGSRNEGEFVLGKSKLTNQHAHPKLILLWKVNFGSP